MTTAATQFRPGPPPDACPVTVVNCALGEVHYRYTDAITGTEETLLEQIPFACGLALHISDFSPARTVSIFYEKMTASVGMGFCLSGGFAGYWRKGEKLWIHPGQHAVFASPDMDVYAEVLGGERVRRISISVQQERLPELEEAYPDLYRLRLFQPKRTREIVISSIGSTYYAVLMHVLHCPFSGAARRLYLEGKVMELLSYKIEEEQRNAGKKERTNSSSSVNAVEKAHHAAYLLTRDLRTPPDLHEVARAAGICRSGLHQVFREVYAMTPFEYLRRQRLEKARELLLEGRLNVTEAAMEVGYASLSHFSKAFAAYFNQLPGDCKKFDRN